MNITYINDEFKKNETDYFISNYQNLLKLVISKINENKYQSEIDKEIDKAYIKAIVRYNTELTGDFKKKLKQKIISLLGDKYKKFYITKYPYLLLHLPKDNYEKGTYHTDIARGTGYSITCWIPINNYLIDYNPITIFPNTQNKFNLYILKITSKISQKLFEIYANIFLKKISINARPNKIFFWRDSTIHRGNYNFTDKIHSALTFKITEKENLVEESEIINNNTSSKNKYDFSAEQILDKLKSIKEFIDKNKKNKFNQNNFIKDAYSFLNIKNNNFELNRIIGFSTAHIGQRLAFSIYKSEALLFNFIALLFINHSNDKMYLKNSFVYLYLQKKINNIDEIIL